MGRGPGWCCKWSEGQNGLDLAFSPSHDDSGGEKLEDGPQFLSSLKKEFSKDTKIVKEIKSFTRSIEPMKNHMGQLGVSSAL